MSCSLNNSLKLRGTASSTFTNSTFCPHSVFMCFVWIWEQTAIISLYRINWLVCITETECVYCAVRTEYLNIIQKKRTLFLKSRIDPRPVFVRFVVDRLAMRQVSIRILRFPPASIIPPMLRIYLHPPVALTRRTEGEAWNLPNSNARQKTGRSWIEKYFDLAFRALRPLRSQHRNGWTLPRSRPRNNHDTCLLTKADWDWTPKLTDWLTDWWWASRKMTGTWTIQGTVGAKCFAAENARRLLDTHCCMSHT
jgi:hypothetical protein